MLKRAFERIPAKINVRFFSEKTEYLGTVTNLSEKGMFISSKVSFPLEPQLKILIPLKEEILNIPVQIRRLKKSGDMYNGIGVEILNPPQNYLDFVIGLRSAL